MQKFLSRKRKRKKTSEKKKENKISNEISEKENKITKIFLTNNKEKEIFSEQEKENVKENKLLNVFLNKIEREKQRILSKNEKETEQNNTKQKEIKASASGRRVASPWP